MADVTVKLQFKALGFPHPCFHDKPKDWKDGDVRECSEPFANIVLELYPKNFFRVGGK